MLLPASHLRGVLDGEITRARLPIGSRPKGTGSHPVQRPGGASVCRVKVTDIDLVLLDAVTDEDAVAEGYPDWQTYRDEWCRLYNAAWTGEQAWLVEFEVVSTERRLFLASGGRSGNGSGYMTSPPRRVPDKAPPPDVVARIREARTMADEPEAVDPEKVAAGVTSLQQRQRAVVERAEREALERSLPLADQLARLTDHPRAALVRNDLRVIAERLEKAWGRLDKAA